MAFKRSWASASRVAAIVAAPFSNPYICWISSRSCSSAARRRASQRNAAVGRRVTGQPPAEARVIDAAGDHLRDDRVTGSSVGVGQGPKTPSGS
jgi:hypothetical protein